jgi:hypothetical protein
MIDHLAVAGATRLYLDGSFVTEKETPNDFDACYDIDALDMAQLPPQLLDMGSPRDAMKSAYLGEAFPSWFIAEVSPGGISRTFRMYFQQLHGEHKGIVTIDLRTW